MTDKENISPKAQEAENAPVSPEEASPQTKKSGPEKWSTGQTLQSILNGTFLTREQVLRSIPYLFFLAFLGLIYIANTYQAERTISSIDACKKELKELRYEHITVKSELMYLSKQSEISRRLEGSGLKPVVTPPVKITLPAKEQTPQYKD